MQTPGKLLQTLRPSGDDDQMVAVPRQTLGERGADPGRGAGDERQRPSRGLCVIHGVLQARLPSKLTGPRTNGPPSPPAALRPGSEILRTMNEPIDVTYRPGSPGDATAAAGIIVVALNDLMTRQNRAPIAGTGAAMSPVLAHLARTDPRRFWIATCEGRPVAFGSAWVRSDLCYLSGLFVLPDWQGRGLGRGLLERAMGDRPSSGGMAAVMSSAANPVSNGLYARRGMYPAHAGRCT